MGALARRLRPLAVPALATAVAAALLIGLGVWQLHRLAWKTAILTAIADRAAAAPQPLPPAAAWAGLSPDTYEYRRVALDGTFLAGRDALVFRATATGPGYLVLTPIRLASGGIVVVNRGLVPSEMVEAARGGWAAPTPPAHVVGLMRGPEARNAFTPSDEPARRRFFTRDPAAIARALDVPEAAPFTVDADATPNPTGWPRGGTTVVAPPNNHLSYALTWFGLALGLVGVFAVHVWRTLAWRRETGLLRAPAKSC